MIGSVALICVRISFPSSNSCWGLSVIAVELLISGRSNAARLMGVMASRALRNRLKNTLFGAGGAVFFLINEKDPQNDRAFVSV